MQRTRFSRKVLVVDDEPDDMIIEKNQLLAELQTANAKLTEANRLKGIFLEVASHELNTPVTVVLGLTDLWKLSLTNDATGPERQWVDRINAAARRLAKTVQRMFFFRKLDVTDKSPE
ncbi:MAG: histidine kinase dimerization/phospho-acceptor domain-containing protein [Isosphaeraceae bacterium]